MTGSGGALQSGLSAGRGSARLEKELGTRILCRLTFALMGDPSLLALPFLNQLPAKRGLGPLTGLLMSQACHLHPTLAIGSKNGTIRVRGWKRILWGASLRHLSLKAN
jgi:hypothetical protein